MAFFPHKMAAIKRKTQKILPLYQMAMKVSSINLCGTSLAMMFYDSTLNFFQ